MLREARKRRPLPRRCHDQQRQRRHRRDVRQQEDHQQDERGENQRRDDALAQHQRRPDLLGHEPEAALPPAEMLDRGVELALVEVRPQRVAEVQLGVGEIPQQEIADALLAAGADQQVGIRQTGQRQLLAELRLVDVVRAQLAGDAALGELPRGASDVPAPAVRDGDDERHACYCRR